MGSLFSVIENVADACPKQQPEDGPDGMRNRHVPEFSRRDHRTSLLGLEPVDDEPDAEEGEVGVSDVEARQVEAARPQRWDVDVDQRRATNHRQQTNKNLAHVYLSLIATMGTSSLTFDSLRFASIAIPQLLTPRWVRPRLRTRLAGSHIAYCKTYAVQCHCNYNIIRVSGIGIRCVKCKIDTKTGSRKAKTLPCLRQGRGSENFRRLLRRVSDPILHCGLFLFWDYLYVTIIMEAVVPSLQCLKPAPRDGERAKDLFSF